MQRIDESEFKENGWHGCSLKYVKLISFPDAADMVAIEPATYLFKDILSRSQGFLGPFESPSLHSDGFDSGESLFFWHRIEMHGQEYIAVIGVRPDTPFGESDILVNSSGHDGPGGFLVEESLKVQYKTERCGFLPVSPPDGSWITPAMARIKTNPW